MTFVKGLTYLISATTKSSYSRNSLIFYSSFSVFLLFLIYLNIIQFHSINVQISKVNSLNIQNPFSINYRNNPSHHNISGLPRIPRLQRLHHQNLPKLLQIAHQRSINFTFFHISSLTTHEILFDADFITRQEQSLLFNLHSYYNIKLFLNQKGVV